MNAILQGYEVSHTAWLFLSTMLIIAVFYRFRRVWSLRNFDLLILLSLSPGILLVRNPDSITLGYSWLFVVTFIAFLRLLFDRYFTQRSRLDPNLTSHGMTFLGVCAFAFLMMEAVTRPTPPGTVTTVLQGEKILNAATANQNINRAEEGEKAIIVAIENPSSESVTAGPTASLLAMPVVSTSRQLNFGIVEETAARILAIISHIAILWGLYFIGKHHFHDRTQGLAMASLYLLMPCTSYVVGEVNQVLPSAFIIWAIACYSRPLLSGVLMGFACGTMFFPIFVLPIWASFYGWKKAWKFFLGVGLVGLILCGAIALISADAYAFTQQTINRIDFQVLSFDGGPNETGFWNSIHPAYRIPVIVMFLLLVITLTIWPWKKNLEVLLTYNTAIIVFTQFWYPQLGGVYVLWYLPLLILVIFRPKLMATRDVSTDQSSRRSLRSDSGTTGPRTTTSNINAPLYR